MLEAVEGGQGDLPCYQILKCAVGSSNPIYSSLGKDERATEQLGLRPAGEDMRSCLQATCKFLLILYIHYGKVEKEFSDNRWEFNSSIHFPIPFAPTEVGDFFLLQTQQGAFYFPPL